MHVILLGTVSEILDPIHDRIVAPHDVHPVIDDVAGMRDPLAAAHELVARRFAKCVAHAAMIAAKADAALDGLCQIDLFGLAKLGHGIDRHDQAEFCDRRIGEYRGGVFHAHGKAFFLEHPLDDVRPGLGFVPFPAAPYDQCLPHLLLLMP